MSSGVVLWRVTTGLEKLYRLPCGAWLGATAAATGAISSIWAWS